MCFVCLFSVDWYKGQLTDKQLHDLENPPTRPPKTKVKGPSRRKPARRPPVEVEEEEEVEE